MPVKIERRLDRNFWRTRTSAIVGLVRFLIASLGFTMVGELRGKSIVCRRTFANPPRLNRNFANHFKLILAVQSSQQKYSALDLPQISGFISPSRLIEEGRTRRHERGSGMRWT
jgi:hypothetical protein